MKYFAYQFQVQPVQPGSEILMAVIAERGFDSFVNTEDGFTGYIPAELQKDLDLRDLSFDDFAFSFTKEELPDQNWNSEWEKNFEPVLIDTLLCVRAPFHGKVSNVRHDIVIMPKMSFGTGHHQTTRLMCREMASLDLTGRRVLDMGCGTGVLAIFAKMLGAGVVTGIDIDAWSVENSKENVVANGFPGIAVLPGGQEVLEEQGTFDVILANINKNILKAQIPLYAKKLSPKGKLLLSGFFVTDVQELGKYLAEAGLQMEKYVHEDEWAVILATRL